MAEHLVTSRAASARDKQPLTPWRERPLLNMRVASEIAGVSPASLYRLANMGQISLKKLAGRTMIETGSLIAVMESAEDWSPSDRPAKALAARGERARASWES